MKAENGGNLACMRVIRNACRISVRKQKGRYPMRDLGIDGRMILK
jgi:hypothetical protein